MKFPEILKKMRAERGYTQRELANLLSSDASGKRMPQSTLAMYELGDREPDFETLERFASFFQVTIDYLLGVTEDCFGATLPDLSKIQTGSTIIQLRNGQFVNLKDLPLYSVQYFRLGQKRRILLQSLL